MDHLSLVELRSLPLVWDARFVSLGEWFDAGTEAFLIDDYTPASSLRWGLFLGINNGKWDEEVCDFDEFILLGNHSE